MTNKLTSLTGFGEGDPKPDTKIDRRKNATKYTPGKKPGPNSEYFGKSYGQLQRESRSAKAKALSAKMGKPEKHYDHKKYGSVMKGRTAEQLAAYKRDSV